MEAIKNRDRVKYLDYLRVIATLSVVMYHTYFCNEYMESIVSYLLNYCVPLFLLITGALVLGGNKDITMVDVLKKKVLKTIGILVLWGGVYNIISLVIINRTIDFSLFIQSLKMVAVADTSFCYQFWYLYMLVGLYLLMPLIKPWVMKHMQSETPSKECWIAFAVLLGVSIILPTALSFFDISITNIWSGAFVSFSGFAFYLLCGCWISRW